MFFSKSSRVFSAIGLDQAHEQENMNIKGNGGVKGLAQNSAARDSWSAGTPELSRSLTSFEELYSLSKNTEALTEHHTQNNLILKKN